MLGINLTYLIYNELVVIGMLLEPLRHVYAIWLTEVSPWPLSLWSNITKGLRHIMGREEVKAQEPYTNLGNGWGK